MSLPHTSLLGALGLLVASGCGPSADGAPAADGGGLVFLPDDGASIGPSPGGPAVRPYFHDFGSVPDGEVVEHVFRLRNTDPRPVAIKRIVPSCGCTVPAVRYLADDGSVVHGEPITSEAEQLISIPPEAIAEIALRIETADIRLKNVDKLLLVTVTTDSENGYYINLETHIVVSRPFELVPNGLQFGRVPMNGGGQRSIQAVQAGGFVHRVTRVLESPAGVTVDLGPGENADHRSWTVTARLEPPLELGGWQGELRLATETDDGTPGEPLTISMAAMVVPDLQCDPARLVFYADPGVVAQTTLSSLLSGQRLRVLAAEVEPSHAELLSVSIEPVAADGQGRSATWTLRMEPRLPLPVEEDMLRGAVRVSLDDPQNPELLVPYAVHLRR